MPQKESHRAIQGEIIVDADIEKVWSVWTTEEGIRSFFAPAAHVCLEVGGAYEIYFDPDAEPGRRGAEGARILALQPEKMLSFTWKAPPHLSQARRHWTHVVIRFEPVGGERTRVSLHHDGWGEGGEWDEALEYFRRAWLKIVLPRLKYRFSVAPVDWRNPPKFI